MKKLALIDDAFLRLENRRQPLHIGVLMMLEPPADAAPDFAYQLADRLRQHTNTAPPFNQKLVSKRGLHYWEEDRHFDLNHHFVHLALPKPGRIRELLAMVSRVHSGHLDRSYPLWRMYLIEGLEDGRIAMYLKMHHAMADGIAGITMLSKCMSNDQAASKEMLPPWSIGARKSRRAQPPVPTPASGFTAIRALTKEGYKAITPVFREVGGTLKDFRSGNENLALAGQAPKCIFNQKVSASRRFAAQSYSMPRIRAVARAFDATANDVILAMCGGALRRYLSDRGELPEESLTAGVPVSVRRKNKQSKSNNEIAFTLTKLATHLDNPAARLRAVKSCMDYNKARMSKLSPGQLLAYAAMVMAPGATNTLLGRKPDKTLGNVIISHVPGPRETMYWQGARLDGLYPVSLIIDSGALNITLVSGKETVDFGLIACRKTVPSVQNILRHLEEELTALEQCVEKAKPAPLRRKGQPARSQRKTTAATKQRATKVVKQKVGAA